MNSSSFVSNERVFSLCFDLPLFLGKMAACPSSGKLEQQRGSTICFHYDRIPQADEETHGPGETTEPKPGGSSTNRPCLYFHVSVCFLTVATSSALFRPSVHRGSSRRLHGLQALRSRLLSVWMHFPPQSPASTGQSRVNSGRLFVFAFF